MVLTKYDQIKEIMYIRIKILKEIRVVHAVQRGQNGGQRKYQKPELHF